jgi:hypothetical protein
MFSADIPATAQAWLVVVSDMEEWGMLNELAHVIGANLSISHPSCLPRAYYYDGHVYWFPFRLI